MIASLPVLYSFRRCPYAMRARLGLLFAGVVTELREIVLKHKPQEMLTISPKGTVPVMQLSDGTVIDESIDILRWALTQYDPHGLLTHAPEQAAALIAQNDNEFKHWLDRYKYADRHPEMSQSDYRARGEEFIQILEDLLTDNDYLLGADISIADIGIMPFVRQFAHVDRDVFYDLPYPNVQRWLTAWLEHPHFVTAMKKYQPWQAGDEVVIFGERGAE